MDPTSKLIVGAACIVFWLPLVTDSETAHLHVKKTGYQIVENENAKSESTFDVKKYGAKADGKSDESKAIESAWKEVCTFPKASTLVISKGDYLFSSVKFEGPCKSPVTLRIEGQLKAPAEIKKFSAHDGWVNFQCIDGLTVYGDGTFDGQGSIAWANNDCRKTGKCNFLPINIRFHSITNSKIQKITSLNSKLFHMNILNCKNLTLQDISITGTENSLNTDGIHIGRSNGVNITGADIQTEDDSISLGDGSQNINIEKVNCGPGHGISVGSLGRYHDKQPVKGVTMRNCTLTNTMKGVTVKTWPSSPSGVASDMHFEDIIMNNVSTPILIDQLYCPYGQCETKNPSRVRISNVSFKNIMGTSATKLAMKLVCSRGIPCQKVDISDVTLSYKGKGPAVTECSNVQPTVSGRLVPSVCGKTP